jgi:hypothetical protein
MNEVQERTHNPFGDAPIAARPSGGAVAQSDQQRAIAEVQAAMVIARMNPRDPIEAMDRILNACARPTLAEAAVYQYSRGGQDVTGPSIRLAEAIAQSWGNFQFGIRELEQRNGESTVQAFAWDVETNTRREVTFQVPHLRHTRNGSKRLEDPRDVYEMVANQGARRLRACILAVIPGDVTEAAVRQCEATMKAKADTSPEGVRRILEAFAEFAVTKEQIEKRIQRRMDAIQPAQVVALRKIHTSLRDGMSVPADWFEQEQPAEQQQGQGNASAAAAVRERLKQRGQQAPEPATPPAAAQIDPADRPDTGAESTEDPQPQRQDAPEHPSAAGRPAVSYAQVADALSKAATREKLDEAALLIDAVAAAKHRSELVEVYKRRQTELEG